MAPNTVLDFGSLSFNLFDSENVLGVSESFTLDVNFFNSVPKGQIEYFSTNSIIVELNSSEKTAFSILPFNIKSLNKNFQNLKNVLVELRLGFQIICLTESWCSADSNNENIYGLSSW